MISVVIPCFNAQRFLAETVESVFSQTFRDYEIILVDDGSTDGTAALIRSFGLRVRAEFRPHGGVSKAREWGTGLSRGEFVQYLDADDLLTPESLERKAAALSGGTSDVAYTDWSRLVERPDGRFEEGETVRQTIQEVHPRTEIAIFTYFWAPPAAVLYRRSVVEAIGGWSGSLPVIQDARFMLDAALHGARFAHVPFVGARYREHGGGSLSRRSSSAFLEDILRNADEVRRERSEAGGLDAEWKKALLRVYGYVARSAYAEQKPLFDRACERLLELDSHYRPESPWHLRAASAVLGYRRAESLAMGYRRAKKMMGGR